MDIEFKSAEKSLAKVTQFIGDVPTNIEETLRAIFDDLALLKEQNTNLKRGD